MKNIFNNSKSNFLYNNYGQYSNVISPFIDEGEFLDHRPPINRNYTIDNFEYITDCNQELITIGKGGYGKLYLARNKKDNKEYAIKYVSKKKMQAVGVDSSIIKREIDIHIRITHPRIIKLLSYLEDRYNFYLAMEYAPKGTLYQLIQQKRGMNENESFYYFIQVASAIYFLHMNGYAHRDIKPENILLDGNGGIKLCDFGWCVNVAKGERTTFCGTYEYMAPEMINDEFYDMGIDIWSLGVLLYEMLHGYSPFRAHKFVKDAKKAQVEIFINIKNNNYTINKDISEECIDLIDKLLTIDTRKRIKIDELFKHPWVVNKEKEYFPFYKRYKEIKTSSNNITNNLNLNNNIKNNINNSNINSHRRIETDIDCIKSSDFNRRNGKILNMYNQVLNEDKEIIDEDNEKKNEIKNNFENKENEAKSEKINSTKHNRNNKSYCFVYTKGNSLNNGIYFIQGKSGNKNNREEKISKIEKEKDRNNYEFNKIILTETNQDLIIKNNKNELNPIIEKKDINAKNNFVYSINSRRKKINLPRVIRTEKKELENNLLKVKEKEKQIFESQEIKSINLKLNEKSNIKPVQNVELRNYSKPKNDKKSLIRVQRQELDDYLKNQNEINDLNLKMEKIKEKQEIVFNKLKKIEERRKREESLKKLYDSHKSNTSYDYYNKARRLKSQFSYINIKPKKEIGSYSIKQFGKENNLKNNKIFNFKDKLNNKRSKSFQQLLNDKTLENKIKNLLKEKRSINKVNNLLSNINKKYLNNDSHNLRNINNNKGEDDINIKENFKRFRKMVVHLKKRNSNLNINTGGNLYNSYNSDKIKNADKLLRTNYPQLYIKTSKANKSIQNIYYNTFYNCLFNNEHNNNNAKVNNYYMNNKNIIGKKNDIIKAKLKSISSEKNIFKYKNILDGNSKKIEYPNHLNINKENEIVNYSTERKRGNFLINPSVSSEKNKIEKDKSKYIYTNYKNHLINSGLMHYPSSKNEIV